MPLTTPQEKTPIRGEPECLLELTGQDLIGTPVRSPNATHERVYVLPLLTILTNKGTGVVTSVPSDSPDDYRTLVVVVVVVERTELASTCRKASGEEGRCGDTENKTLHG